MKWIYTLLILALILGIPIFSNAQTDVETKDAVTSNSNVTSYHFSPALSATRTIAIDTSSAKNFVIQVFSGDIGDGTSAYTGKTGGFNWWVEGKPGTNQTAIASATQGWATVALDNVNTDIHGTSSATTEVGSYGVYRGDSTGFSWVHVVFESIQEGFQVVVGVFNED